MTVANRRDIRVDDLRHPVLTAAAREAFEHAERNPVELTEAAVLSAAQQMTGLDDFGPDDFHAGLRSLLAETASTPLDRVEMFRCAVHHLGIRLRLHDLLRRHPEIHELPISRPIVIVGPARSGTTYLQGLLAADSRLRSLRLWEASEPVTPVNEVPAAIRESSWYIPYGRQENRSSAILPFARTDLLPHFPAMLPLAPDDVAQETMLMDSNFPADEEDPTPQYEYMKTVLKALQWQRGPDRWVLKAPMHCEHIGPLLSTFPDATVVMTHRDPMAMIQSLATMFGYVARLRQSEVDVEGMFAAAVDRIESMVRSRMRDQHLIPADRVVEVLFHEFTRDQLGTVERIHATAGFGLPEEQRKRMIEFRDQHRPYRHGRVVYDMRADFGVDPTELRERFAFYYERFPVKIEIR